MCNLDAGCKLEQTYREIPEQNLNLKKKQQDICEPMLNSNNPSLLWIYKISKVVIQEEVDIREAQNGSHHIPKQRVCWNFKQLWLIVAKKIATNLLRMDKHTSVKQSTTHSFRVGE